MLSVGAAAHRRPAQSIAREMRAEMRVHSVSGLAAIVLLAADINSGISLSWLQYNQIHIGW